MINIIDNIRLRTVSLKDQGELYALMSRIYPAVYQYLWDDDGAWYIDQIYTPNNLEVELSDPNGFYYFVEYDSKTIGILRIVDNCSPVYFKDKKGMKLHRIYLDPAIHGKGIGKTIINWTKEKAQNLDNEILWLEAMDTSLDVIAFYEKLGFEKFEKFEFPLKKMEKKFRGMYRMWWEVG